MSLGRSSDRDEPPHVHVKRDDKVAKLWLRPIREAYKHGFRANELNRIVALTRANEQALLKAWHEYFTRGDRTAVKNVNVTNDAPVVELQDGRVVSVPLDRHPKVGGRIAGSAASMGTDWPGHRYSLAGAR